jgi:hypothetical protein
VGCEEGLFDVEAVLKEDEGAVGVGWGESRKNEIDGEGDVRDVFGCEHDVVVWREGLGDDFGGCIADCACMLAVLPLIICQCLRPAYQCWGETLLSGHDRSFRFDSLSRVRHRSWI